jgi:hypothetical protein
MEEFQPTQQPEQNPNTDVESGRTQGERRSATQGVYEGEERRKADQQLDNMAKGQQDG